MAAALRSLSLAISRNAWRPTSLRAGMAQATDFLSKALLCEMLSSFITLMTMNFRAEIALCPEEDIV
jgi:hypothetical protein